MITEVGRILEMTHKAGLSHEKLKQKGNNKVKQKLINLINKYEKKLALPVDNATKEYYLGKISAYEHSLILLESYREVI